VCSGAGNRPSSSDRDDDDVVMMMIFEIRDL
jgi:hypothetical protein